LLVAKGTDIRDKYTQPGTHYVEVPLASGRFYKIDLVDDVARGFTNEYRIAIIRKVGTWPSPIP
jgi:hypothetical protein